MNNRLFYLIITLLLLGALWVFGLTAYPYDVLTDQKITLGSKQVNRGAELCYTMKAMKNYDVPAMVTIELINSENFLIMSYPGHFPKGHMIKTRCFIMPYHISPGTYQLSWSSVFHVNPIRNMREVILSESFEVR
jgi:hypothetical protein